MAASPMTTQNRPRRERPPPPPPPQRQYTSAEAAAAAQSDGYKPREERGWEEFHKDLDIDVVFPIFPAEEVDGLKPVQLGTQVASALLTDGGQSGGANSHALSPTPMTPVKRRPGRPPRRPESMLSGLGSPPAPKIIPLPLHNPKERLNLNKPSFRRVDTFGAFERDESVGQNYVDKAMANVGYQESDIFVRPVKTLIRHSDWFNEDDPEIAIASKSDGTSTQLAPTSGIGRVEYDMDEQDDRWLEAYNTHRKEEQSDVIKPATFEIAMTLIEKCWHSLEKRKWLPSC
jgi:NuA3 HAT complex component NTO1